MYNPLNRYERKSFSRYCQTQANRAKHHEKTGIGLNKTFKKNIEKAKVQFKDLIESVAPWKAADELDSDDDDDYIPEEEEESDEESISEQIQDDRFSVEVVKQQAQKKVTPKKTTPKKTTPIKSIMTTPVKKVVTKKATTASNFVNNIYGEKYLVNEPNGVLLGVVKVDAGFDLDVVKYEIDETGMFVGKFVKGPPKGTTGNRRANDDPMADAVKILKKKGWAKGNTHVDLLNEKIVQLEEKVTDEYKLVEKVFVMPFECRPSFCDPNGEVFDNRIAGDDDLKFRKGVEWLYFWMKGVDYIREDKVAVSVERNNKNRRDRELEGMQAEQDRLTDQLRRQHDQMREQARLMEDMQRQMASLSANGGGGGGGGANMVT